MKNRLWLLVLYLCTALTRAEQNLPVQEYERLNRAFEYMAQQKWQQAQSLLQQASRPQYSKAGRAIALYNLGQLRLRDEQHSEALQQILQAYRLESLSPQQQSQALYSIAQLQCLLEDWQACSQSLERWQSEASDISPEDYHLLAYAYSQLQQWQAVLAPIGLALAHKPSTPVDWQQLKIIAHIKLRQWPQAIAQARLQTAQAPRQASYWQQLIGLQIQQRQFAPALANQRLAINHGALRGGDDFYLLADLFHHAGAPHYAGRTLQQAMARKVLARNPKNLKRLLDFQILARDFEPATDTLKRLQQREYKPRRALQLARIQLRLQRWRQAELTLVEALQERPTQQDAMRYLLAQALITQGKLDQARNELLQIKNRDYRQAAQQWLQHIEALQV